MTNRCAVSERVWYLPKTVVNTQFPPVKAQNPHPDDALIKALEEGIKQLRELINKEQAKIETVKGGES